MVGILDLLCTSHKASNKDFTLIGHFVFPWLQVWQVPYLHSCIVCPSKRRFDWSFRKNDQQLFLVCMIHHHHHHHHHHQYLSIRGYLHLYVSPYCHGLFLMCSGHRDITTPPTDNVATLPTICLLMGGRLGYPGQLGVGTSQ